MATSTTFTNAEAYRAYVESVAPDLLSKMFHSAPTPGRVTNHVGIKGKLVLTELVLGTLARRWSTDFNPVAGQVDFVPRELDVEAAKVELQFYPQQYESSYLGEMRRTGQNPDDLPFEAYTFGKIVQKIAQEIEISLWKAVKSGAPSANDPLNDVFDGYLEIIADEVTATNLTPVAVSGGAWTTVNIITTLESMYSNLDAAYKENEVDIFLSYELMELYNRAYRDTHGNYAMRDHDGRMKLDFGPAYFRPTPGLTGSDRVLITPAANLHYAYDAAEEHSVFNFEQDKRAMDFWADFKIGVEFGIVDDTIMQVCDLT